jgi:hypothetical protein
MLCRLLSLYSSSSVVVVLSRHLRRAWRRLLLAVGAREGVLEVAHDELQLGRVTLRLRLLLARLCLRLGGCLGRRGCVGDARRRRHFDDDKTTAGKFLFGRVVFL